MTTAELYRISGFNSKSIAQTLYATYQTYIHSEMHRLIGYVDNQISQEVLEKVRVHMSDISMDCDLEYLVFDILRKEIIARCRENTIIHNERTNPFLKNMCWYEAMSEKDSLRIDILLIHLTKKQRTYFLNRYYYLNTDTTVNKKYESVIHRLINGKGIASLRFNHFKVPVKAIQPSQYIEYLNTLEPKYIDGILTNSALMLTKVTSVPTAVLFAERQYRILSRSVPIAAMLLLLAGLAFLLFCIY